jgi:hypothetical protein
MQKACEGLAGKPCCMDCWLKAGGTRVKFMPPAGPCPAGPEGCVSELRRVSRSFEPECHSGNQASVENLICQLPINMRQNYMVECPGQCAVLERAILCPLLRKVVIGYDFCEYVARPRLRILGRASRRRRHQHNFLPPASRTFERVLLTGRPDRFDVDQP